MTRNDLRRYFATSLTPLRYEKEYTCQIWKQGIVGKILEVNPLESFKNRCPDRLFLGWRKKIQSWKQDLWFLVKKWKLYSTVYSYCIKKICLGKKSFIVTLSQVFLKSQWKRLTNQITNPKTLLKYIYRKEKTSINVG